MKTPFFLSCLLLPLLVGAAPDGRAEVPGNAPAAVQPEGSGGTASRWNGMVRLDFRVAGRPSLLIVPDEPLPGKPWIWRTEFFNAFPAADIELARRGFHVGYIQMENMYGSPEAMRLMDAYYAHVTTRYGLSERPVLEGLSRGGLYAFNWGALHPEKVAGLYVDAPVCDIKSWPGGKGKGKGSPADWERLCKAYGLSPGEALAYKGNPVDCLAPLVRGKVPILAVVGEADDVVPVEENISVVERRYRELGGRIHVISKPGVGHHPHGLQNPAAIVHFAMKAVGAVPPVRVVCVGDSITFGAGTTPAERWSERLQQALGKGYAVYNLGVSSTTLQSTGDCPYADRGQYRTALQIEGDIILLALGTNDSKPQNWKGRALFAREYEEMIRAMRKSNPRAAIYCLLPIPAFPGNYGISDDVIREEMVPTIRKVAQKNKCAVIDLYRAMKDKGNLVPDKVHPNGEGHAVMAACIRESIANKGCSRR